jgi:hypothetical protein
MATNMNAAEEEGNCELSGNSSGSEESGDVGIDNVFSPATSREGVPMQLSREEDAGDEASPQPVPSEPAPSEGSRQGKRPDPVVRGAHSYIF